MKLNLGNLLAIIGSGTVAAIVFSMIFGRDSKMLYAGYLIGALLYIFVAYFVTRKPGQ